MMMSFMHKKKWLLLAIDEVTISGLSDSGHQLDLSSCWFRLPVVQWSLKDLTYAKMSTSFGTFWQLLLP